jgi:Fic family protein
MIRKTGEYEVTSVAGESVKAFVPFGLPPRNPPLLIDASNTDKLRTAENELQKLELAALMVPSIDWFIYAFVRKEAVLSSQIEGTQATLVDLLAHESQNVENPDGNVEEVCNYLDAMNYARDEIAKPRGLPLSMRLFNQTHKRLMSGTRGKDKAPGEIRRTQNWIGGSRPSVARFVPPPPQKLAASLSAFEKYLHSSGNLPPLVRAGLLHVQFETIHPYLDGNGRIGRLLIGLLLEQWRLLSKPILYLSLYFKRHRDEYYQRLNAVREKGDWEGWISFFLDAVAVIAAEAGDAARSLFALFSVDRARVIAQKRMSIQAIRLFELLPKNPIVSAERVTKLLGVTKPTAMLSIELLVKSKVLKETSLKRRGRTFAYQKYLDILRVGTELD